MSWAGVRVGIGARFRYDGETVEVVEMAATTAGNEVVLRDGWGHLLRLSLAQLLFSDRAVIIPDSNGPSTVDDVEIASVALGQLDSAARKQMLERAEHVRELMTGYRSGTAELAQGGEPRSAYAPGRPWEARWHLCQLYPCYHRWKSCQPVSK